MFRCRILWVLIFLLTACSQGKAGTSSGGGADSYSSKVAAAYQALSRHPEYYHYVTSRIAEVKEVDSKTGVFLDTGIFELNTQYAMESSTSWLACILVHEAAHMETGADEQYPLAKQRECLRDIDAPYTEIAYADTLDGLHFDTNGNGVLDHNDDWGY